MVLAELLPLPLPPSPFLTIEMTAESSEQTTFIHSLVTLSISDQWTRARVQNGTPRVAGACLGKQSGRNIEIMNTFEVKSTSNEDGIMILDEEYFNGRAELFKETFSDLEFLGFYITGAHTKTDLQDTSIQKQAMKFSESPFLLKFDTAVPVVSDKLSLGVFESVVHPVNESELIFHSIPVKIVSELSEQIGFQVPIRAIWSHEHSAAGVSAAHDYVSAVKEGKVETDEVLLKDIYKLCQKLCEVKSSSLVEKETKQASDKKLLVLLTAITNVQGSFYDLVTKLNILSSERFSTHPGGPMSMKKHAYAIMRLKFPLGGLGRSLFRSHVREDAKSVGLFGNFLLSSPNGFENLAALVQIKSRDLVERIVNKRRHVKSAEMSERTSVAMVDDLSNEICCAADLTECTRSMHCDGDFADAAEKSMRQYTALVETLNTTPELYQSLKESLVTEKDRLDEVDLRTAHLLLEDFENSGVHLEKEKREKFVALSDEIFSAGVHFSNGVDRSVSITNEEAAQYGFDFNQLSNPWRSSNDYRIRRFTHSKFFEHSDKQEMNLRNLVTRTYDNVYSFLDGIIKTMRPSWKWKQMQFVHCLWKTLQFQSYAR
uniref:COP9 signalosome complex subunit 6 n=1 Tax=Ditylenchus dipsaci TaxID=166011 RepID=A0A915E037_9BILA